MGRPREFDEDDVLERAMKVFWSKGYASTSLDDLLEGTGVGRQSLYSTFGDKHTLFVRALRRYLDNSARALEPLLLEPPSAAASLRAVFMAVAEEAAADKRRGCMLVNTITELVPADPDVTKVVSAHHRFLLATFRKALERAAAARELVRDANIAGLAHYLVAAYQGLRVVARVDQSREHLAAIVDGALHFLV